MNKRVPFQNIDRMRPRSQRREEKHGIKFPTIPLVPETHVTANEPATLEHILGTEGCYINHQPKAYDD